MEVEEQITLKSEVINLEFDLKSFKDKMLRPVLVIRNGSEVLARLLLSGPEYTKLKGAFAKSLDSDWRLFDGILNSLSIPVDRALGEHKTT